MPLYDYDCATCKRRFEIIHGVHADGPASCPFCGGGPVRKAISAAAVHYKGSGWAKKERRATTSTGGSTSKADDADGGSGGDRGTSGGTSPTSDGEAASPGATDATSASPTSDRRTETKPEAKTSASAKD